MYIYMYIYIYYIYIYTCIYIYTKETQHKSSHFLVLIFQISVLKIYKSLKYAKSSIKTIFTFFNSLVSLLIFRKNIVNAATPAIDSLF